MSDKEKNQEKGTQQQVFGIISQYTKDLSFENVTPASKISSEKQPEIDAQSKSMLLKQTNKTVYIVSR